MKMKTAELENLKTELPTVAAAAIPPWTWKPQTQTAKPKKKNPLHGPGWCHICARYTGRKLTVSKFFTGGSIPPWAVVHPSCNRREKPAQFRERLLLWLADRQGQGVAGPGVAADERGQADATSNTSGAGKAG